MNWNIDRLIKLWSKKMKLKDILLLIAACTIVLGITYLTVIIYSGYEVKQDRGQLTEVL